MPRTTGVFSVAELTGLSAVATVGSLLVMAVVLLMTAPLQKLREIAGCGGVEDGKGASGPHAPSGRMRVSRREKTRRCQPVMKGIAGSMRQSRMWSVLGRQGLAGGALVVGAHLGPCLVEVAVQGEQAGIAEDEGFGTGVAQLGEGLLAARSVDLDLVIQAVVGLVLGGLFDLGKHLVDERLSRKADVDGHQCQQVDAFDQRQNRFESRERVDDEAGAAAEGADRVHGTERVGVQRLDVRGDDVHSDLGERLQPIVGIGGHEMRLVACGAVRQHPLKPFRAQGEVRCEVTVHDVKIKGIGVLAQGAHLFTCDGEVHAHQ